MPMDAPKHKQLLFLQEASLLQLSEVRYVPETAQHSWLQEAVIIHGAMERPLPQSV